MSTLGHRRDQPTDQGDHGHQRHPQADQQGKGHPQDEHGDHDHHPEQDREGDGPEHVAGHLVGDPVGDVLDVAPTVGLHGCRAVLAGAWALRAA